MYGEPRIGTEAYAVKQEAERRKKIATDKHLDQLIIDAYDAVKHYPAWIKDERNKRWVYPLVSEARTVGEKYSDDLEFKLGEKVYKITRGDRWTPEFGEGTWYKITLMLNNNKVFEITEEETNDQYSDYHRPVSVNAYLNDDWVSDFQNILTHKKRVSAETEIEYAEDPKRTRELKEAFGIDEISLQSQPVASPITHSSGKSIWSKWWVWAIIVVVALILLNQ